ncbi:sensor histidine kinase [Oerskovia sp. KBS0722]|uniref:sensor histidine kinase n=1 Tax=Oerskovia sp. KBS0722 TaxID=1179673 RepID=UPI00110EC439|nr:histidine kinase [Oerskovia sp. KBS0722]QDW64179.1 sensor histidine kinase [Oerskovia sp. KBS0722]
MGWYENMGKWWERHRFGVDMTTTLVVALAFVPAAWALGTSAMGGSTLSTLFTIGMLAPLPWRRVRPVASAITVYAVALLHLLFGIPFLPADFLLLLSLFSVTVYGPRWAHRTAMISSAAGSLVLGLSLAMQASGPGEAAGILVFTTMFATMMFLAVWAFGLVRRSRRETINALVDRAERLEVERDQQAQIATAAERSRIAREMHDIVAHSLSVIIAQADGGRYAGAADPAAATRALTTVSETGRAALADMRRLLGVLRTDDRDAVTSGGPAQLTHAPGLNNRPRPLPHGLPAGPSGPSASSAGSPTTGPLPVTGATRRVELNPQPDSADLETLVAQVRDSGMRVSLVRMGTPRALPPGAGLTVYRVCQEALTNILKHAGPDPTVTVVVTWGVDTLQLAVDDDGRGASADGSHAPGYGLLGMRERAVIFGGAVTTGPRPGGGFRVRFTMPIPRLDGAAPPVPPVPGPPSSPPGPTAGPRPVLPLPASPSGRMGPRSEPAPAPAPAPDDRQDP